MYTNIFCIDIPLCQTYIPNYLKKNLKAKKSPPPSLHHPNKPKVSGVKSEILPKQKRIKWTPSRKASRLLPGESHILKKTQDQKCLTPCTNQKIAQRVIFRIFATWSEIVQNLKLVQVGSALADSLWEIIGKTSIGSYFVLVSHTPISG